MPAQRPAASFTPIAPNLDLAALVEETPNFQYVVRVSCDMIEHQGVDAFEKLVLLHVIIGGKPLVVEGFHNKLDRWTFTTQWLRDNMGRKFEQARNLTKKENMPISINHYLTNLPMLTNQLNPYNYAEPNRQRVYLKDIDCPQLWHDKLKEQIPRGVFYLNDETGAIGGPGSKKEPNPNGLGTRKGRGIARAGDLMSCLPPPMRAENMMCYIGHEGTYTPAHREMCASLGQNIMVEASGTVGEDGKPTKPGSSVWFMTETKDRHLVSEYWLSTLGHDIEVEAHFAQINAWKRAPFTVYIVEQKVGDFLLIPPLAPHQVWNRGTRTMKAAWNRTTVETLEMALDEALPRARMVCRDEQYKTKAIVLFSLQKYSGLLKELERQKQLTKDEETLLSLSFSPKIRQLKKDFKRLHSLYTQILLSEMLTPVTPAEKRMQYIPYDSNVTCSYCRCNIFNRFLTCTSCVIPYGEGEEDVYDICMECYTMGRSCKCLSKLRWVEQFPWRDLVEKHELWGNQIKGFEGEMIDSLPRSLDIDKKAMQKKSLAEICQEQLKLRPWQDPKKETAHVSEEEGPEEEDNINPDGSIKKKPKIHRSAKWLKDHPVCHVCTNRLPKWKMAECSCGIAYCYGTLWRAFDMMPHVIMEDLNWKCPRCTKICSCGPCSRNPAFKPFDPTGTVLGHDTKKIADPRSVESLVDFSHSNMHWVKKAGDDQPHQTRRLQRRQDEAAYAKSTDQSLSEHYVDDNGYAHSNPSSGHAEADETAMNANMSIDPALLSNPGQTLPNITNLKRSGGAPVADMRAGTSSIRTAAVEALNRLNGLSRLEQDPEGFKSIAGLGLDMVNGANHFGNSVRQMHGSNMSPNGIAFEYPDPTGGQTDPNHQTSRYNPPSISYKVGDSTAGVSTGQKRKRTSEKLKLRSDFDDSPKGDANRQFQQLQLQRTMAEARRKGRYISADAAISGKSLVVKLPVNPTALLRITDTAPIPLASGGAWPMTMAEPEQLLESDRPKEDSSAILSARAPPVTSRKWAREEKDEDFTGARPPVRPTITKRGIMRRRSAPKYVEASQSEMEEDELIEEIHPKTRPNGKVPIEKPASAKPTRRSLPTATVPPEIPATATAMDHQIANPNQPDRRPASSQSDASYDLDFANDFLNAPAPKAHSNPNPNLNLTSTSISSFKPVNAPSAPPSTKPSKPTTTTTTPSTTTAIATATKSPRTTTTAIQAANRTAKMKAMNWAHSNEEEEEEEDSSASSSGSSSDSSAESESENISAARPARAILATKPAVPARAIAAPGKVSGKVRANANAYANVKARAKASVKPCRGGRRGGFGSVGR